MHQLLIVLAAWSYDSYEYVRSGLRPVSTNNTKDGNPHVTPKSFDYSLAFLTGHKYFELPLLRPQVNTCSSSSRVISIIESRLRVRHVWGDHTPESCLLITLFYGVKKHSHHFSHNLSAPQIPTGWRSTPTPWDNRELLARVQNTSTRDCRWIPLAVCPNHMNGAPYSYIK